MTSLETYGRKLKVLRAELDALSSSKEVPALVDAVRGVGSASGSRWDNVSRYLSPEILLRLDRTQSVALYATLTEVDPPKWIRVDQASVDKEIEALGTVVSQTSLREAYRALESAIGRTLSGPALSSTQSALHKVGKMLKIV